MKPAKQQSGMVLLEALIGILIFTLGIIGLMGMQAAAIKMTAESKYRNEAMMFADRLISQMQSDNTANTATDYAGAAGAGGNKYAAWVTEVTAATTGLPGSATAGNLPTVTVVAATGTVTITLRWMAPGETVAHQFTTVAVVI
jgi:type IV pilus assembly protein PilV